MNDTRHTLRNGIFCVLVFLACYVLAWPVAQMGFMDDWSYIWMARAFARTGHVTYVGWGTPMVGWMIPWGALFIKLFGFSFMAVKLSTLPIAVATLLLFHAILRRFEIGPRNAVIGTLTLGLSPLFLPLSASFMTDIPGLFVIVLCLYLCQRALGATTDRAAIGWLVAAALSNVVGGTARQVAWLGVLVMVPCTGWLLRKRREVFVVAMGLWVTGTGAVFYCMHWFAQQPGRLPMPILPSLPRSLGAGAIRLLVVADLMGAMVLCLLLVVFPLLAPWVCGMGKKADHYLAVLSGGYLPLFVMVYIFRGYAEIWPQDVLLKLLATQNDAGSTSLHLLLYSLIPIPVQAVVSLLLIAAAFGFMFAVRDRRGRISRKEDRAQAEHILWLFLPYTVGFFAAILIVAVHAKLWGATGPFDRYLLDVMPCGIVLLIWCYERMVGPRLPSYSVGILVFYAFISVAGTHSWFAWQRARVRAIDELRAAGIPRNQIQGGYEYDGWTQIKSGGVIHFSQVRVPSVRSRPKLSTVGLSPACSYWFRPALPVVVPKYSVGVMPFRCYLPSKFPSVHYTAWLPPFRRVVEVQRVPGA